MNTAVVSASAYGINVKFNGKKGDGHDDIQSILFHSGVFSPHLERLKQVSAEICALEWRMMKRAASSPVKKPESARTSGD